MKINPLVKDVMNYYIKLRRLGKDRDYAIHNTKAYYSAELTDDDDRFYVIYGLATILLQRKEMTNTIATEMDREICFVRENAVSSDVRLSCCDEMEKQLQNQLLYGNEAYYKKHAPYIPEWNIGDAFRHTLTIPSSKQLGIYGWSIVLYKIDEIIDEFEQHHHLFYVSICPPGKEPQKDSDFLSIGFLPMMHLGTRTDYRVQALINNRKDESMYGLKKIGNFFSVKLPDNRIDEHPLTTVPLYGPHKDCQWPGYEDMICRKYREYCQTKEGDDPNWDGESIDRLLWQTALFLVDACPSDAGQGDGSVVPSENPSDSHSANPK